MLKIVNATLYDGCVAGGGHFFKPGIIETMMGRTEERPICGNCGAINPKYLDKDTVT